MENSVQINHTNRAHSECGGSSADRWSTCTGSVFLSRNLPLETAAEHAAQGTRAHELCEIVLEDFLNHKIDGTDPDVRSHLFKADDDEMLEAAYAWRDVIWDKVLQKTITNKAYSLEDTVTLSEPLGMFGSIDFWCVYTSDKGHKVLAICDFKYGYWSVDVHKNAQLAFYACALRSELKKHGKKVDYARGVIFQPRIEGKSPYKETKFTIADLDKFERKFLDAGHQIYIEKKPKFKVGDHCKFCKAQGICPTYKKEVEKNTAISFADAGETVLPDVEKLSDEQVLKIVLHEKEFKAFFSAAKKYVINRAIEKKPIEGTKLVSTKTRRKWDETIGYLIEELEGLGIEEVYTKKPLGITVIEKQLAKLHGKEASKRMLSGLTTETKPTLTFALLDDPRPAVENVGSSYLLEAVDDED